MKQQLSLGELISKLESCDKNKTVWFNFSYLKPTGEVFSYRGYYDQLAIEYSEDTKDITVTELLDVLKKAVGKVFEGYKGGEYVMREHTPVWVDKYSYGSGTAVVDVEEGYCVVIVTEMQDRL